MVMAAGGVGATARFLVGSLFAPWSRTFPIDTLLVNLLGSFLLGWVVGLGTAGILSPTAVAVLGAGFCGGFTTFSTAAVDAYRLFDEVRTKTLSMFWLVGFVMCAVAGAIGWAVGAV